MEYACSVLGLSMHRKWINAENAEEAVRICAASMHLKRKSVILAESHENGSDKYIIWTPETTERLLFDYFCCPLDYPERGEIVLSSCPLEAAQTYAKGKPDIIHVSPHNITGYSQIINVTKEGSYAV